MSSHTLDFDPREREVMRKVADGIRWYDDICPTSTHYYYLRQFVDKGYISPMDWGSWLVESKRHCLYIPTEEGLKWWASIVDAAA